MLISWYGLGKAPRADSLDNPHPLPKQNGGNTMMKLDELNNKVARLRQLRHLAAQMEAEAKALEDEVKGYMDANGLQTFNGPDWRLSYKTVESRRFDKAAMIQTFGQSCYDGFCKVTTSRRFVLS